jgi:hypothetical protein
VSDAFFVALLMAVALAHAGVFVWALARRGESRRLHAMLTLNLLFAAMMLFYVIPLFSKVLLLPHLGEEPGGFLDFKGLFWCLFELVTAISSAAAFWGRRPAKILAWLGFAENFAFSAFAVLFALAFKLKCCGFHNRRECVR